MAEKKRTNSDYRVTRFQIKAHRHLVKKWPAIVADIDAFVTAELEAWARENDLVLTERRRGKEREITADPRWLVNRKAEDAKRQEELAEARRVCERFLTRPPTLLPLQATRYEGGV